MSSICILLIRGMLSFSSLTPVSISGTACPIGSAGLLELLLHLANAGCMLLEQLPVLGIEGVADVRRHFLRVLALARSRVVVGHRLGDVLGELAHRPIALQRVAVGLAAFTLLTMAGQAVLLVDLLSCLVIDRGRSTRRQSERKAKQHRPGQESCRAVWARAGAGAGLFHRHGATNTIWNLDARCDRTGV